ncbi:MAG: histidine kinase internal region [Geminicoccaceae bacterium]|nr:histidine kinase internal region [Geminicoccaceae bacterium]
MRIGRLWLVIAVACVVPAVLDGSLTYVQARLDGRTARWEEIFWQANEWLILGALTPLVYWLARLYPIRPPFRARNILAHFGGALALCVGWAGLGAVTRWVLGIGPTDVSKLGYLTGWLLTTIPWGTFMYFTTLGCMYAFAYFVEAKEREAQAARLAAQIAEARLGALRMQLHPHFLFNSLNAITVLVRDQDTAGASRMLELLSDVLRQVLRTDQTHEVSLADELSFLERYLAIEQVRFSDRLRVEFNVDDSLRDAAVPAFLLQPLVENALRHGISRRDDAGQIAISAREEDDVLVLEVRDDGPGIMPDDGRREESNGVGLRNVRERLTTMYGANASLRLQSPTHDGHGTVAVVTLPLRRVRASIDLPADPLVSHPSPSLSDSRQ